MSNPASETLSSYTPAGLFEDFSLEITGRDIDDLSAAVALIPTGTRINVTSLSNETVQLRLAASKAALDHGFIPVPHISARRMQSSAMLEDVLGGLHSLGASGSVFVVGGDTHTPEGPYRDALELIETGLLQKYGATDISIAGYPDGHPDISDTALWSALTRKLEVLAEQGTTASIVTQFGFDEDPVVAWIDRVRAAGISNDIRVGVPGRAGIKRLLAFAARCGVSSSAGIAKKYGLSLTNLMGTAGPDKFLVRLAQKLDRAKHGVVKLHFYTFGGLPATAEWIRDFTKEQ